VSAKPSMRVTLPWLHEAIVEARAAAALPTLPSLAWLAGRGAARDASSLFDWRRWLLGAADVATAEALRRWPAGPSLAAAATAADPRTAVTWGVAQPVHLAVGMDHVRLAPLADAVPSAGEAESLAATLGTHFAGDGFGFGPFVDGAWVVRCTASIDCTTHDPAAVVGRNVHDFLPAGPDGACVRSVMNEIQMLLHDHPVNQRRVATRALPINGLWLWGFGTSEGRGEARLPGAERWTLYADDLWLSCFWRNHGGATGALGDAGTVTPSNALIALAQPPTTDPGEALAEVDSSLLARLRGAVQSGDLHLLELFDGARVHSLDAYSRWRVWRRPATQGES
jgi:hypothetical protein